MFAVELSHDVITALQAVALALVGAWVAVRTRQVDQRMRNQARRNRRERMRCDGLERRVLELERQLGDCLGARTRALAPIGPNVPGLPTG